MATKPKASPPTAINLKDLHTRETAARMADILEITPAVAVRNLFLERAAQIEAERRPLRHVRKPALTS